MDAATDAPQQDWTLETGAYTGTAEERRAEATLRGWVALENAARPYADALDAITTRLAAGETIPADTWRALRDHRAYAEAVARAWGTPWTAPALDEARALDAGQREAALELVGATDEDPSALPALTAEAVDEAHRELWAIELMAVPAHLRDLASAAAATVYGDGAHTRANAATGALDRPVARALDHAIAQRGALRAWTDALSYPAHIRDAIAARAADMTPADAQAEITYWASHAGEYAPVVGWSDNDIRAEAKRLAQYYTDRDDSRGYLAEIVGYPEREPWQAVEQAVLPYAIQRAELLARRHDREVSREQLAAAGLGGASVLDALVDALWGVDEMPYGLATPNKRRHLYSPAWWSGELRKAVGRLNEMMGYRLQLVGGRTGVEYCSAHALARRVAQRAHNDIAMSKRWMKNEHDEKICLGASDPARKRHAEAWTRIDAIAQFTDEHQLSAGMLTLTAPGQYHPNPRHQDRWAGWNGASPLETHRWIGQRWGRIRALWQKRNVTDVTFLRTVEPHADGCPHWHVALTWNPDCRDDVLASVAEHFHVYIQTTQVAEDGRKTRTKTPYRVHCLDDGSPDSAYADATIALCDDYAAAKGVSVGRALASYAMKYVNKHTGGKHYSDAAQQTFARIDAWRGIWAIRAFQFGGLPPITPYREARKQLLSLNDPETDAPVSVDSVEADLGGAHALAAKQYFALANAAQAGDFAQFCRLNGGVNARAKDRPLRTYYVAEKNEHGEEIKRLKGTRLEGLAFRSRYVWTPCEAPASAQLPNAEEAPTDATEAEVTVSQKYPRSLIGEGEVASRAAGGGPHPPTGPPSGAWQPDPADDDPAERSRRYRAELDAEIEAARNLPPDPQTAAIVRRAEAKRRRRATRGGRTPQAAAA